MPYIRRFGVKGRRKPSWLLPPSTPDRVGRNRGRSRSSLLGCHPWRVVFGLGKPNSRSRCYQRDRRVCWPDAAISPSPVHPGWHNLPRRANPPKQQRATLLLGGPPTASPTQPDMLGPSTSQARLYGRASAAGTYSPEPFLPPMSASRSQRQNRVLADQPYGSL